MKTGSLNRKIYEKVCPTCGTDFEGFRNKKFCRAKCSPAYKKSKKANKAIRKRAKTDQRLKCETWAAIGEYYLATPDNMTVDHIIPLNHPRVSGLHNTWNFQYLSADDNSKKVNQFDGTPENDSWK